MLLRRAGGLWHWARIREHAGRPICHPEDDATLRDFPVHATVPASDLARARRFYEETLGFEADSVTPGGVVYRSGGSWFLLFQSSGAGTNEATACGFQVPDMKATVAELKGRGVRFEDYDMPGFKTVDGIVQTPVGSSAWFKDSEGNVIGLVQLDQPVR